ncbi:DUF1700 domain-containing protein [Enterococcus durans]|uniref:DUF1700 domain-containing protein n=1 Tax=Enterococcus durans TaxID=53345 RepID=A0A5N0YM52_9ENTE|nr:MULTISPECIES: DUF1700 domain-containing protein [Enterococcus]KAA9177004.1 DUF1700 domain-containing protein [Enterococcus durans]KAA9182634.1 DUF1700 domain-containing protein [Enterococcus durans]KAA9183888.1 DUF1700 domain-containing protein [Enterococcus durans]KAA9188670.1 DUF1700 domain-containing protein [Enterococcus durans]KAA9190592.1 DUF1700 domain-containing protein [Enterococcus durans]
MNEYLDEVFNELQELPEDDRFDLIQYYEEYFLDSGKTMEKILEEYGTPKQFALKLKINYFSELDDSNGGKVNTKSSKRQVRLIWMVIIGLCASPLLIPLAIGFIAVIFGLMLALLMIIAAIYVGCISILGVGLFAIISGVGVLGQSVTSGLFYVGMGLFATGSVVFFVPILLKLTKLLFQMMMNFVKWVGRRFVTNRTIHPSKI